MNENRTPIDLNKVEKDAKKCVLDCLEQLRSFLETANDHMNDRTRHVLTDGITLACYDPGTEEERSMTLKLTYEVSSRGDKTSAMTLLLRDAFQAVAETTFKERSKANIISYLNMVLNQPSKIEWAASKTYASFIKNLMEYLHATSVLAEILAKEQLVESSNA